MATALNSDTPVKTSHYSPMLHNAILSIGLCYCDEPQLRTPAFRKVFVTEAKKHVEVEGKNPTVATVQALAHLASGHSVDAEHNLGWLYIGMALRCALARESTKESAVRTRKAIEWELMLVEISPFSIASWSEHGQHGNAEEWED
jgi:hypothetical protein